MGNKLDVKSAIAILISIGIQAILWPLFIGIFSLDSTLLALLCIVLISGIIGIAVPCYWNSKFVEDESVEVLNMPLVVAQGLIMAYPLLTCSDWSISPKICVTLVIIAIVIYIINAIQIINVIPDDFSMWQRIKAFLIPGLIAFAIASIAVIIIAVVIVLTSGKKKKR